MTGLDTRQIAEILGPNGPFVAAFDRFELRPGQQQMAAAVAEALAEGQVALIEAGTGTGKSLAYLVPAALFALQHSQRVVISTNTINLQEQLLQKDIPLIQKSFLPQLRARLVKGWGNYLCLLRLHNALQDEMVEPEMRDELAEISRWADQTQEGSLSDLERQPAMWGEICAESDNCLRNDCPFFSRCFLFRDRAKLEEAHLLVVNHYLLFADMAVRRVVGWDTERSVLPAYNYAIIDEAHHLEKVATDLLGDYLSQYSLSRFLGRLHRRRQRASRGILAQVVSLASQWLLENREPTRAEQVLSFIEHSLYPLLAQIEEAVRSSFDATELWLWEQNTRRSSSEGEWHTKVGESLLKLDGLLTELNKDLRRLISDAASLLEGEPGVRMELEALSQRGVAMARLAKRLARAEGDDEVFWVERQSSRVRVVAASLDVASAMQEWISNLSAAVLTSATLTIDRSFAYMKSRLGLSEVECKEHIIPSPFDYKDQVLITVPTDIPDPNDPRYPQALTAAVTQFVKASGGRALVLFTSYSMLRYVAGALEPVSEEEGWPLLIQGEQNRSFMLHAFRHRASVLLGTNSFWEGVDVPGEALSCLIITRLPFFVPDEPIVEARLELLRQRGYDPFYNYSLPDAVLKFKQGFGRLIRTGSDRGVVVICDRRIVTRYYGKIFWASLPECQSYQGTVEEIASAIREWL